MAADDDQKNKKKRDNEDGWWFVRFKVNWSDGEQPKMYIDLFIAHRVVNPILDQNRGKIKLWRIHRRAAQDKTGHEFKFIFYSSKNDAKSIYSDFRANTVVRRLKRNKILDTVFYDSTKNISMPGIGDTCDPVWSNYIKQSWPYYIMGVSEMVLVLLDNIYTEVIDDNNKMSLVKRLDEYRLVDEKLTEIWQNEGKHAFLHHLNALFGYKPMPMIVPIQYQVPLTF